ncbi:helix-turn-helix domain-containing protein [Rhodococcus spongiicola]|uniref:XRE family transcriptional regulator n=1 Tax=Rhodococcus spongiicola TaxID=2487352 RepID=A0A3S3B9H9_9NOCA|nr:helix-turn-helix domain-containing protein [Rhodococcus spongiicola]RVW06256.1 XRE family transcriptional regulator [Rhodococcus spongiicola]
MTTPPPPQPFTPGRLVREMRESRGVKRKELARLAPMSEGYLEKLETGARPMSVRSADKIGKALGVDDNELAYLRAISRDGRLPKAAPTQDDLDPLGDHLVAVLDNSLTITAITPGVERLLPGLTYNTSLLRWLFTDPQSRIKLPTAWKDVADVALRLLKWRLARYGAEPPMWSYRLLAELNEAQSFHGRWVGSGFAPVPPLFNMPIRRPSRAERIIDNYIVMVAEAGGQVILIWL